MSTTSDSPEFTLPVAGGHHISVARDPQGRACYWISDGAAPARADLSDLIARCSREADTLRRQAHAQALEAIVEALRRVLRRPRLGQPNDVPVERARSTGVQI